MKGFKFRLQSVLDARQKKFEDSQLEFAKAKNELYKQNLIMETLIRTLDETNLSLEEVLKAGNIDNTIIFVHQNYILKIKEDIKKQHELIQIAEKNLEEKNQLMLEALKAKKVMEKLREKAQNEFKENISRQELLLIDEIATCRYKKAQ